MVMFCLVIWQGRAFATKPTEHSSAAGLNFSLQFSTYFGGTSGELLRDMTVDAQGNIYIAGSSGSTDLPTTPGDLPGDIKKRRCVCGQVQRGRETRLEQTLRFG